VLVGIWSVDFKSLFAKTFRNLKSDTGSANIEFVLLAIPLFVPILIFIGHFAELSNSELLARNLARESLRAYVTSENPLVASFRANQVLRKGAQVAGLESSDIDNIELKFNCSMFPCLSPGGRVQAIVTMKLPNQNRVVQAEAIEFISPWQWTGIPR
jgi:hypothetical protein